MYLLISFSSMCYPMCVCILCVCVSYVCYPMYVIILCVLSYVCVYPMCVSYVCVCEAHWVQITYFPVYFCQVQQDDVLGFLFLSKNPLAYATNDQCTYGSSERLQAYSLSAVTSGSVYPSTITGSRTCRDYFALAVVQPTSSKRHMADPKGTEPFWFC